MTIAVRIPETLRAYCGVAGEISLSAATVSAALSTLRVQYPALYGSVCDETGAVRRHINLFINSELIDKQDGRSSNFELTSGDVLTIWTAVSGG
ncbi:MAG: MoaD/ThiS family protein [Aureliella sp.]